MTDWLRDLETESVSFFAYEASGTVDDPYDPGDGTTTDYDWFGVATAAVRYEPRGDGYVREGTGERVHRAPRAFAPPSLLGTDGYAVDDAGELEGEALARGGDATDPTHRIVTAHHKRLDRGDEGILKLELEVLTDG